MLQCIKFILQQVVNFSKMLFTIDIGNHMSLGLIMCIIFIFLPVVLRVLTYIKHDVVGELDEAYDDSRIREVTSNTRSQSIRMSPTEVYHYNHTYTKRRRWR